MNKELFTVIINIFQMQFITAEPNVFNSI